MPGPRPTPTLTLAARGSWRANERAGEPTPSALDDLTPPPGMKGRAAKVWKALAPRLAAAGVLTSADAHTFSRYCRLYAAWEEAMKAVEESPDRGTVLTLGKLDEMVRKLEGNFGLTPADRTGLRIEQPETPADDKGRFFKKAG